MERRDIDGSSSSSSEQDFLEVLEEACGTIATDDDDDIVHGTQARRAAVIPSDQLPPSVAIPFGHAALLTRSEEDHHRITKMQEWLAAVAERPSCDHEVSVMHGVELRATDECGVGVFATEAGLGPGHVALILGRDCILSHQRALDGCGAYYDIAAILEAINCPPTTAVALFLVARRALDLSPTQPPHDEAGPASSSHPGVLDKWVATLPGYARLDCPIRSLYTTSTGEGTISDPEQDVNAELLAVQSIEDKLRRQVGAVLSYIEDELQGRATFAPFFPTEVFSKTALTWALGLIYSRGFDCGMGAMTMLPLIDMVNHAAEGTAECNCKRCFDHSGAIVVVTSRAIDPGEELCHTYAPNETSTRDQRGEESQLRAELMVKYGVPPARAQ